MVKKVDTTSCHCLKVGFKISFEFVELWRLPVTKILICATQINTTYIKNVTCKCYVTCESLVVYFDLTSRESCDFVTVILSRLFRL